ncbi:MAG: hypothetical protein ACJZ2F_01885 [Acidimicrobiales bacterium]|nr:hypothetical protein [Acidimicrobiaceae bacterium]
MTLLKTLIKATVYWSYPVKLGTSPPVNAGGSGGCVMVVVAVGLTLIFSTQKLFNYLNVE